MRPIREAVFSKGSLKFLATAALIAATALAGCTPTDDDGKLAVFHGVLKDDVKTWDPANAYDTMSLELVPSVYETLYQYSYLETPFKIEPLLAADLPKFSKDRLTVTIPLRHGVRYQDDPCFAGGKGREIKAQDFIYEFKRLALPSLQSQGFWIFDGKLAGINAFHDLLTNASKAQTPGIFDGDVAGMRALDDYTIQLKLLKPYPQLLYVLAMSFTAPVPPESVAKYADEQGNLTNHPVGSGPFLLKRWDHHHRIVLDRNPNFHDDFYPIQASEIFKKQNLLADAGKKLPFLDRISMDVIIEAQPRWLNFMKGTIDEIELPKDNFQEAITNQVNLSPGLAAKGMRLAIESGVAFYYVSFNMKDKLVGGNKWLRQAISSAIDRDKWIEIFTNGTGRKQVNTLPPGIADRPESSQLKYDFDLARAKALLAQAGYPEGKGLPPLNFDLRAADSVNRQLGEFFTRQLEQIGIKLNVIPNSFPAYLEKSKQGNLQISEGGWSLDYPDAENVYQILWGPNKAPGPNEANYDNPKFNALYVKMATMRSSPARAAIVKQMDDMIQEDCPWALGYYYSNYAISQAWFLNYRSTDMILNKYKYFRVDRDTKKRYLDAARR